MKEQEDKSRKDAILHIAQAMGLVGAHPDRHNKDKLIGDAYEALSIALRILVKS